MLMGKLSHPDDILRVELDVMVYLHPDVLAGV
jgi:hypothetical protein